MALQYKERVMSKDNQINELARINDILHGLIEDMALELAKKDLQIKKLEEQNNNQFEILAKRDKEINELREAIEDVGYIISRLG
jgi:hypothetical protein